jgi:hypothetical protein
MVPTVAFKPLFGSEVAHYTDGTGLATALNSPPVYLIFWGSFWQNTPGAAATIASDLARCGGTYLAGITQYHTDGNAIFENVLPGQLHIDGSDAPSPLSPNPPWGDPVSNKVEDIINDSQSGIPNPTHTSATPIYAVITDPNVKGNSDFAFNEPSDNLSPFFHEVIWVSTRTNTNDPTGLDQDFTTREFSHELVEAMTDPNGPAGGTHVSPGATYPDNEDHQLADYEPNNHYFYRVGGKGGVVEQAYWSQTDPDPGFYIVPDGNSLTMEIDPNHWDNHSGTLVIDTGQAGVPASFVGKQEISLRSVAMGGDNLLGATIDDTTAVPAVEVVMDGETFDFEPGQITGIQVIGGNNNETIKLNLYSLPAGVTFDVAGGNANWKLKVVDDAATAPPDGRTALISKDAVTVNGNSVAFSNAFLPISLEVDSPGATTIQDTASTMSVDVVGSNTVNLVGCSAAVTIQDANTVVIGAALHNLTGSLAAIHGPVSVTGSTALIVNDAGDYFNSPFTLINNAVLFGPPNSPLAIIDETVASLTLDAGFGTRHIFDQQSLDTPITINPLGPCWVSLLPSAVNLASTPGAGLVVDASTDPTNNPLTITGTQVLYGPPNNPLVIINDYPGMTHLTVDGGPATPIITVAATSVPADIKLLGSCSVSVCPASMSLDQIAGHLTIKGSGNTPLMVNDGAGNDLPDANTMYYRLTDTTLIRELLKTSQLPAVGQGPPNNPGPATMVTFTGLGSLSLALNNHASRLDMEGTLVSTTIVAGAGATAVNLAPVSRNLNAMPAHLKLTGGGSTTLSLYDQANNNGLTWQGDIYSFGWGTISRTAFPVVFGIGPIQVSTIDYTNLAGISLWAAKYSALAGQPQLAAVVVNHIQVLGAGLQSTNAVGQSPGSVSVGLTPLTVHAGTANDKITVVPTAIDDASLASAGFATGTHTTSITGNLTVDGGILTIDGSGAQNNYQPYDDFGNLDLSINQLSFMVTSQTVEYHDHFVDVSVSSNNAGSPGDGVKPGKGSPKSYQNDLDTTITYSNLQSLTLDGGPVDTAFTVGSTAANTPVKMTGAAGSTYSYKYIGEIGVAVTGPTPNSNTFQIGNNGSVKNIASQLTLIGAGLQSTVVVDDSQTTPATSPSQSQDLVTIGNGATGDVQVGKPATDRFFATGGGLDCTGMSQLTLDLSQAPGDVVHVTPSAVTALFLNGSPTEYPGPGAAMLDLQGVVDPAPFTPGTGKIAFANNTPQSISYTNMVLKPAPAAFALSAGGLLKSAGLGVGSDAAGNVYAVGYVGGTTTPSDTDGYAVKYSAAGVPQWTQVVQGLVGGNSFADSADAIAVDAAGNSYVAGDFRGTLTLGNFTITSTGPLDVFVEKLDTYGTVQWLHQFANTGNYGPPTFDRLGTLAPKSIAVDHDHNVVVTGIFTGHLDTDPANPGQHYLDYPNNHPGGYVVKLDASGKFLWQAEAVNPLDNINADALAVDANENVYVLGDFGNFNYFNDSTAANGDQQSASALTLSGPNITNLYVWKLHKDGTNAWVSQITSQAYNTAIWGLGIAVNANGDIYTTGAFNGASVDFDPTASHVLDPDIVTSGNFNYNTFVDKIDANRHWVWTRQISSSADNWGRGLALDSAGNAYITGFVSGDSKLGNILLTPASSAANSYIAELSPQGKFLKAAKSTDLAPDGDKPEAIIVDPQGFVDIVGTFAANMQWPGLPALNATSAGAMFTIKTA